MCTHARAHTHTHTLPFHLFTYSSLALSSSSSHTIVNLSANPGSSAFRIPPVFPNFSPRLLLPPGPAPIITSLDLNSPLCPHLPRPVLHTLDTGSASPPLLTAPTAPTSLRENVRVLPIASKVMHHPPCHTLPISPPPPPALCVTLRAGTHGPSTSPGTSGPLHQPPTLPPQLHLAASLGLQKPHILTSHLPA